MSQEPKWNVWMPMYWGDYDRDTGHLNNTEHGSYVMLIKHYFCTGSLPDDDRQLWRIGRADSLAAWKKIRKTVVAFFESRDGKLFHKRIEKEIAVSKIRTGKKQAAGRKGAATRWQNHSRGDGDANGTAIAPPLADAQQSDAQSQSQSHSQRGATTPLEADADHSKPLSSEQKESEARAFHAICELLGYEANDARNWTTFISMLSRDELTVEQLVASAQRIAKGNSRGKMIAYIRPVALEIKNDAGAIPAKPADAFEPTDDWGWKNRIRTWNQSPDATARRWLVKWGPPPTDPANKIPSHLAETAENSEESINAAA